MFSLRQYCLDFLIFTMIDSKFHFSPTFTSNLFFWTRNKNDICLKHTTSSTLVKCNSMIISIVMPSYPNVTSVVSLLHVLIIIAFPCNKFAFLEIKLESRFSLICFLNIYFDRFCMCSENVSYKLPLCEGLVLYGVFVIIVRS